MQHDFIMRSKMSVIKSKMGTIKSKIGRKFEQKRKAKWVKEKANLVKAYSACTDVTCKSPKQISSNEVWEHHLVASHLQVTQHAPSTSFNQHMWCCLLGCWNGPEECNGRKKPHLIWSTVSQLIEQKNGSPKTLFQGLHLKVFQGSLFKLKWNLSLTI